MTDTKWLTQLEQQVEAAVEELKSLRKDNRAHKTKIKQLQQRLAEARGAAGSAGDWEGERQRIRERVERLAAGLEELL